MGPTHRRERRPRTVSHEKGSVRRVSDKACPVDEIWDEGSFQVTGPEAVKVKGLY